MRIILPGLLATAVLYPVVAKILRYLPSDPDHLWERIAAYALLVFLLGALISTANSEIYRIYEGRVFWPRRLREWARKRQQARVSRLRNAAESAKAQAKPARDAAESAKAQELEDQFKEMWYELRVYPTDDQGEPEAQYPTRIGNILAAYEQYPKTRYGMDSVFYWPRIWMQIEKDKKEEIDSQWSVADGFLSLSAISFAGGSLWMVDALAAWFKIGWSGLPLPAPGLAVLGGAGWLVLGFLWYRRSLPFHRQNGEMYKSIFDIYRDKVWNLTSLKPHEKEMWYAAWAYLQYLKLKCPNCEKYMGSDKCEKCGLPELTKNLRDSGKFLSG